MPQREGPVSSSPVPPRTPGLMLGAVVVAVAVLVAAVALTSRQAAPPTIAEFAPQSVAQIKQTLAEQSEQALDAAGQPLASPPPAPTAGPSTSARPDANTTPGASAAPTPAPVVSVPRVRQCVGSPPRQTEDPQSPPCVPYFDPALDNGGATHKGVTKDSITIAVPQQFFEDLKPVAAEITHFNKRYEFYGRKLLLQPFSATGCVDNQPDPAKMRADAVAVDEELGAFATLAYFGCQGADHHYYDALAERQVLSIVDGNLTTGFEANYAKRSPYQWNVMAGIDTILASTAQFVCASLAGRPPRYAGATQARASTRTFGLITTRSTDGTTPDVTPLRQGLASCGVTLIERRDDQSTDGTRNGVATIVALQNAGVTSVLCVCSAIDLRNVYMPAATAQGFQPEWVESSYINNDLEFTYGGGNAPPDQAAHVLGVSFRNKLRPRQDMPWFAAVREGDPSAEPAPGVYYSANSRYLQLLLLASGIQLAGPELTPQSFAAGLVRARFANPGAGGAPAFQARVGFAGPRHVMSVDAAMFWFDGTRPGVVDPSVPGRICYLDGGRRTSLGDWRRSDPAFFASSCP